MIVPLALAGIALVSTTAFAQRSAVTVDRNVLDSLGPADPTANHLRLHLPTPPVQQQSAKPASGKSAPVQATGQSPAAVNPPSAAPMPQAALTPPARVAPSTATPVTPTPPPASPPGAAPATSSAPATAALPGAAPGTGPAAERILFQPDDANLADDAKQELDRLAARLTADGRLYVQLVAYASGSGGDASQARRLSLSRALAARSYLVDHGVEIKQIDIRPLGNKYELGAVPDRIDLVITQR